MAEAGHSLEEVATAAERVANNIGRCISHTPSIHEAFLSGNNILIVTRM